MMEITEGTCTGIIYNWELVEVEAINQLKLVIWFKCEGTGWKKNIKFEGFFLKKDGTQNKKTYDTLKRCGFNSSDIGDLISDENALDRQEVYTLDIKEEDGYWYVDWVNVEGSQNAITNKQVLKGHNLSKLNSFLGTPKPSKKVKNYAHGGAPPQMDTDEDIDQFLT